MQPSCSLILLLLESFASITMASFVLACLHFCCSRDAMHGASGHCVSMAIFEYSWYSNRLRNAQC